jgi:TonB-dependent starch-binding outer membrane protein SusC
MNLRKTFWKQISLFLIFAFVFGLQALQAQKLTITGKITNPKGEAFPGVTVIVKGTTVGTASGADGSYIINVPADNAVLQFSFIGYSKQDIPVSGKTVINVTMAEAVQQMEEVVVVGYGTQSRKSITGSMANVKAEDLNTVNAVSIDNMMQGKAAGLNILANTAQPGGGLTINIRGALSPNGSNSPLYVIDGVPITNNDRIDNYGRGQTTFWGGTDRNPLNTINPNDIESVDVLKDASVAAIYGSAAANGVILITTKRGKEQKTTVTYNGTYSVQTSKKYLEPLNSTDFMKYHELYGEEYWKYTNKIAPYGSVDPSTVAPYIPRFSASDIANAGNGINTNWIDYLLQDGIINDQNISIEGGTTNTKAYTSFNYLNQRALLKHTGLNRFSGRLNLDQKIGSRVLLKLGISYSQVNNQNENTGYQGDPDSPSPIQSAIRFAPTFGVYDTNGNLTQSYLIRTPNPHSWLMIKNDSKATRLFLSPSLNVKITDALKVTLLAGIDESRGYHDFYVPVSAEFQTVLLGDAQLSTNFIGNYNTEGYLSYDKEIGKSRLSVVAGTGYYKTVANDFGLEGIDFFTDAFGTAQVSIAANKDKNSISSGRSERTKISQFFRVNYTLLDRYIITFNGRNDGSSIWAEGHKWGFFPGISAAWVISQENFLKAIPAINQLKLRAGYGTVGNEGMLGNYSLSTYGPYEGYYFFPFGGKMSPGVLQTQLGNPAIRWEKDITVNAGLDIGIFNDRISGSFDYYVRTAKDLFNFRYLPSNSAIARIGANVGSTRSRGFEVLLKTININTKSFTWSSYLTFSSYKSYWVERSNPEDLAKTPWVGLNDEIHAVYGWKTSGIIKSVAEIPAYQAGAYVGNIKYVDANNDGKLDEKDVQYLGNTDPKAFYGFGNTFTYKGFDLNIFVNGTLGGLQGDNWQLIGKIGGSVGLYNPAPSNAESHVLNTWATFNPDGTYPGLATDVVSGADNPSGNNDFGLRKVNWGRLKNITLGYNLPSNLLSKTNFIQSVRVFVDLQNFVVFGNYSGLDPEMETNSNFPYPIARTTAFGLSIKF